MHAGGAEKPPDIAVVLSSPLKSTLVIVCVLAVVLSSLLKSTLVIVCVLGPCRSCVVCQDHRGNDKSRKHKAGRSSFLQQRRSSGKDPSSELTTDEVDRG